MSSYTWDQILGWLKGLFVFSHQMALVVLSLTVLFDCIVTAAISAALEKRELVNFCVAILILKMEEKKATI